MPSTIPKTLKDPIADSPRPGPRLDISPSDYLKQTPEDVPSWLSTFKVGDSFSRERFFASRIVYYPGSGTDGSPVKLFGSAHSAHSFVYADYGISRADLEADLTHPTRRFLGYHTLARIQLTDRDLSPTDWVPHLEPGEVSAQMYRFASVTPFGFIEVLERDPTLDDRHGAPRLAILFLGADGIAAYDALFCQEGHPPPPWAVVLHDYGFGGGYERFGRDGLMERIATRCQVFPRWLLVADNTFCWNAFARVPNVARDCEELPRRRRSLYWRIDTSQDASVRRDTSASPACGTRTG